MTPDSMRMGARPLAVTSQPAAPPAGAHRPPSERIHYLDWLRVLALLGVFLYHAVHPFDTLDWHVKNTDQSQLITGVLVFEAQFTALRYFTLDGSDHPSHAEQASMIRRYIAWRNRHAHDRRLGEIVNRANVA